MPLPFSVKSSPKNSTDPLGTTLYHIFPKTQAQNPHNSPHISRPRWSKTVEGVLFPRKRKSIFKSQILVLSKAEGSNFKFFAAPRLGVRNLLRNLWIYCYYFFAPWREESSVKSASSADSVDRFLYPNAYILYPLLCLGVFVVNPGRNGFTLRLRPLRTARNGRKCSGLRPRPSR
jgi:hypothetical protein